MLPFNHMYKALAAVSLLTMGIMLDGSSSQAQSAKNQLSQRPIINQSLTINHLSPKSLPAPGTPLTLTVDINGTKDASRTMRLLAVLDGVSSELTVAEGTFSTKEIPSYSFSVISPLRELRYQFISQGAAGDLAASATYALRQPCVVNQQDTESDLPSAEKEGHAERIVALTRNLEQELAALEEARRSLGEIKMLLRSKRGGGQQ
jgi:hypothetical protein